MSSNEHLLQKCDARSLMIRDSYLKLHVFLSYLFLAMVVCRLHVCDWYCHTLVVLAADLCTPCTDLKQLNLC